MGGNDSLTGGISIGRAGGISDGRENGILWSVMLDMSEWGHWVSSGGSTTLKDDSTVVAECL